ncbi:LysE family translocator [Brenneria tiliae]|uniref:LysE family translocator n=1 Tax=Brenneria tiliae TaxID=2914984 RepID=UPI0020150004|nr:LysE family translocator [Brenneria tiliae]MCL2897114.1 LysE family translocator [Brenneria tiliae]MCL2904767.1 LysE family translocator [Brenneria tiliae]
MFEISTLLSFVAVVISLFMIPGPSLMLVLNRTVQGGRKVGIMTGLGLAVGDFIHTLLAAVGLSALLMTSAIAFSIVKYVGAVYLIYLGIRAFRAKTSDPALHKMSVITPSRAFLEAIPAEVLNPKTSLFFLAFIPQFVHPERGTVIIQFFVLGVIFAVLCSLFSVFIAFTTKTLMLIFKNSTWLSRWHGKLVGMIFITIGFNIAIQKH